MCDYCGCRKIAVIGQLMTEHEAIVEAAGDVRRAAERGDERQLTVAIEGLASLIQPHTEREEQGLFAQLMQLEEFADHTQTLCREHEQITVALTAGRSGDVESLLTGLTLLRDHIDREEFGLFPAAAISLPVDVMDALT